MKLCVRLPVTTPYLLTDFGRNRSRGFPPGRTSFESSLLRHRCPCVDKIQCIHRSWRLLPSYKILSNSLEPFSCSVNSRIAWTYALLNSDVVRWLLRVLEYVDLFRGRVVTVSLARVRSLTGIHTFYLDLLMSFSSSGADLTEKKIIKIDIIGKITNAISVVLNLWIKRNFVCAFRVRSFTYSITLDEIVPTVFPRGEHILTARFFATVTRVQTKFGIHIEHKSASPSTNFHPVCFFRSLAGWIPVKQGLVPFCSPPSESYIPHVKLSNELELCVLLPNSTLYLLTHFGRNRTHGFPPGGTSFYSPLLRHRCPCRAEIRCAHRKQQRLPVYKFS